MSEAPALILAGVVGMGLGAMFFGGLWWTLRKALTSPRPALWFIGSLLVRTSMALSGFYLVSSGHWERLLSCLVGFVAARTTVTWLTHHPRSAGEARHAP